MRAAVLLLVAALGCLGPELQLPAAEPRGVHDWLCMNRACPDAAEKIDGSVRWVKYERGVCQCALEDRRHLPVYVEVPPHPQRSRR